MSIMLRGILIGIAATVVMDLWASVAKHLLRLPTANWQMVGRWFGHMPRGVFAHASIANASPVRHELALGWAGHYLIGMLYGLGYLAIVEGMLSAQPSLLSALGFGLATLFAPWLILQPAMGSGMFARAAPRPAVVRLVNVSMHAVFGIGIYFGWRLIGG